MSFRLPILCLLMVSAVASAATYEVATVDALNVAVGQAKSGDEIVVAAGRYQLTGTLNFNTDKVALRGATGKAKDVVLIGSGMNQRGVDEGISIAADDIAISALTLEEFYYNGIHLRAENDADRAHIFDVETRNIGERHIKGSRDPDSLDKISDDVVIERVHMTQDKERGGERDTNPDYIGGIDMMCMNRLIVRDCLFENIHGTQNGGNAAIFLWNGIEDVTIENNRILGCAKGIGIGNPAPPAKNLKTGDLHAIGGVIRNNVVRRCTWALGNSIGIEICSAKGMLIAQNTVWSEDPAYFRTLSFTDCDGAGKCSGIVLRNNLVRGATKDFTDGSGWKVESGLADTVGSTIIADWFVDVAAGDFHLTPKAVKAIGAGTAETAKDMDGEPRPAKPDLGADQRTAAAKRK